MIALIAATAVKRALVGLAALIAAICFASGPARTQSSPTEYIDVDFEEEVSFGDYKFIRYVEYYVFEGERVAPEHLLIFERNGEVVETFSYFRIDLKPRHLTTPWRDTAVVPVGTDMTGDGEPNLLVRTYSGGAHCCFTYRIYSIGADIRLVDELEVSDSEIAFLNLDGDPALEAESVDYNFIYWYAGYASTPAPRIVFKFRDGRYRIAPELMRRPATPEDTLAAKARDIRTSDNWDRQDNAPYDERLWGVMLDLIYTGHMDRARRFLDEAWPPDRPGKEPFRHEFFDCQLRRSLYWDGVAAMNGLPPSEPLEGCPSCPECG